MEVRWRLGEISTPDLSIHPSILLSCFISPERAVLIADFRTAWDEKISRDYGKMWEIIKGMLCWTVPRNNTVEPCVPKPLPGDVEDEERLPECIARPEMMLLWWLWGASGVKLEDRQMDNHWTYMSWYSFIRSPKGFQGLQVPRAVRHNLFSVTFELWAKPPSALFLIFFFYFLSSNEGSRSRSVQCT